MTNYEPQMAEEEIKAMYHEGSVTLNWHEVWRLIAAAKAIRQSVLTELAKADGTPEGLVRDLWDRADGQRKQERINRLARLYTATELRAAVQAIYQQQTEEEN